MEKDEFAALNATAVAEKMPLVTAGRKMKPFLDKKRFDPFSLGPSVRFARGEILTITG